MESPEGLQPLARDVVPVRVHCEAADCNALLEVAVNPYQSYENPAIVRCGRCRRLLEVNLSEVVAPNCTAAHNAENTNSFPEGQSSFCWAETVSTGFGRRRDSATLSLNRQPVLVPSRDARILHNPHSLRHERKSINIYNIQKPRPLSRCSAQQLSAALGNEQFSTANKWSSASDIRPTLLSSLLKTKNKRYRSHKTKKPSAYNIFMRRELKHVIAANPMMDHREAFKIAAGKWTRSPHSCTNSRAPASFDSRTQCDPPREIAYGDGKDVCSYGLEARVEQPDALPSNSTCTVKLMSDLDRQSASCSMTDLLTGRDSVSDLMKDK